MTDSEAYQATLDRLRADLAKAEATVSKLKAGIIAIQEIVTADALPMPSRPFALWDTNPATKQLTTMREAAIWALKKAGKPMRVRELYDLLMSYGYPYHKGFEAFKGSMIPTLTRQPDFKRAGTGLYTVSEAA